MSVRSRRRALASRVREPLSRLTTRGRSLLAAGATASACSAVLGQRDLLRVGVLLAVLPLLSVLVLGRSRYRLACSRTVSPSRVPAGAPAQVVLEVANVSSQRCGLVLAQEQVPPELGVRARFVLPGLEPGERRAVSYTVRAAARGRYEVGPLSLTLTDPFGLARHHRTFRMRDELVVFPAVTELAPVALGGEWNGSGETRPRALASAGEDDVTTREYRQGDDVRRVHWRSTARRGELMVRREEQPWQSRATLLLDRRRAAHRGGGTASTFEWSVAALASVTMHLAGRGYAVRLVDGDPARSASTRSWARDGAVGPTVVLDRLAEVDVAGGYELTRAVHAASGSMAGGLLVAVLGELDAATTAALAGLHQPGTSCLALLACTWAHQRDETSRSTARDRQREQADRLRGAGWHVVGAEPGEPIELSWARLAGGQPDAVRAASRTGVGR